MRHKKTGKRAPAFHKNHFKPVMQTQKVKPLQTPLIQHYREIGNQAVQRLLASGTIQAKLTIGQPNDKYEQEADRVADQVMRMPEGKPSSGIGHLSLVQRKPLCPECDEKEEDEMQVQFKQSGNQTPQITPGIQTQIQSLQGGGQPLPQSTRNVFEPRFGQDFSQVRVHTDSTAAKAAQSINAKAFTKGKDIAFGAGQYSPNTSTGRRLLAHELTHVAQQVYDCNWPLIQCKQPVVAPQQSKSEDEQSSLAYKYDLWDYLINPHLTPALKIIELQKEIIFEKIEIVKSRLRRSTDNAKADLQERLLQLEEEKKNVVTKEYFLKLTTVILQDVHIGALCGDLLELKAGEKLTKANLFGKEVASRSNIWAGRVHSLYSMIVAFKKSMDSYIKLVSETENPEEMAVESQRIFGDFNKEMITILIGSILFGPIEKKAGSLAGYFKVLEFLKSLESFSGAERFVNNPPPKPEELPQDLKRILDRYGL